MCLYCSDKLTRRNFLTSSIAVTLGGALFSDTSFAAEYSLPKKVAGVLIPDTQLSRDAAHLMLASAPRFLFNHSLRTFVLGKIDAQRRGIIIDEEVAFHAAILHDLCLTAAYPGDPKRTFEENSGHFAVAFARAFGLSDSRLEKVNQAILLHAGRAHGKGPDIEFVMHGARQDVIGPNVTELTNDQLDIIEEEIPRLNFKIKFLSVLEGHIARSSNPDWTADFLISPPPDFIENRWSS